MKHVFKLCMFVAFALIFGLGNGPLSSFAEGSVDHVERPGHRLHLDCSRPQQFKVYAAAGEFINVGSSHLGFDGGIEVYSPDGTLVVTYDGTSAQSNIATIHDFSEEQNGPTGFSNGGYNPGVTEVTAATEGIWTVIFTSTSTSNGMKTFKNDHPWTASDQTYSFGVVAFDITVSKNQPGNLGGALLTGRMYTNETGGWIREFGKSTSPRYFIQTRQGFTYKLEFNEIDPLFFRFSTNNVGVISGESNNPVLRSVNFDEYSTTSDLSNLQPDSLYLYNSQREDAGIVINNKVFFNTPDPGMPADATVTDVFAQNTHTTWLFRQASSLAATLDGFTLAGNATSGDACFAGSVQEGVGGTFSYTSDRDGLAELRMDMNNNGSFEDDVDRTIFGDCLAGANTIEWDGKNGLMEDVVAADNITVPYQLNIRAGEVHVMFWDVENSGGFTIRLLNDLSTSDVSSYRFDHTDIGGGMSGGPNVAHPEPTTEYDPYDGNFGDNRIIDYWKCFTLEGGLESTFTVSIKPDCSTPQIPDADLDGISDIDDIDDDNDGVPDKWEYCNPSGDWSCLTVNDDPTGDNDGDNIPNWNDANDVGYLSNCVDDNLDGICDVLLPEFDTDADGVPDHLDLDSDNDGITDLVEAGHAQMDVDGNGVIDGDPADFGLNGLFNAIASAPDDLAATATYVRWDTDGDEVPDHDDLDSDNDGIFDVAEVYLSAHDSNKDGFIDDGSGMPPVVSATGIAPFLDPLYTTKPIPTPPDFDGDLIPDWHDLDSDNDGINDVVENNNVDDDNDGRIGTGTATVDVWGRCNDAACAATSLLVDTDSDLIPDWHDWDTDNDGINDVVEAGWEDNDNDGMPGMGAPTVNTTGQVPTWNTSDPMDFDGDMIPDWRDLDSDNDGINDVEEASFSDPDNDGVIEEGIPAVNDFGQTTANGGTTSDPTNTDMDDFPDFRDIDSDGDGIYDVMEAGNDDPDFDGVIGEGDPAVNPHGQAPGTTSNPTNTDGDVNPDYQDLDSDNDFIVDMDECPDGTPCVNGDGDIVPDFQDIDRDNDGIVDNMECETNTPCVDTDGDGISDVDDLDSDGDGLPDIAECPDGAPCPDSDNDGIPDFRDFLCTAESGGIPALDNAMGMGVYCETIDVVLSAENTNTLLTGNDASFEWTGPGGFSVSGVQNAALPFELNINNIEKAQAGPYVLTIKSHMGCESTPVTVNVEVKAKPGTPNLAVNDATPCPNSTAELSTPPYSGANVEYQWWYNGAVLATTTNPVYKIEDFVVGNEGDYSVITIADDCASEVSNVQSLDLTQPSVDLTAGNTAATTPVCEDDKVNFSLPLVIGATYAWTGPNGFTATSHNPVLPSVNVDDQGEYFALVQMDGCTFPSTITTVNIMPKPAPLAAMNNSPICENTAVELGVAGDVPTGNVVFEWYNEQNVKVGESTTPNFTLNNVHPSQSGNYVAKVSVNGCKSDAGLASFLTIDEIPEEVAFVPENPVYACQEDAVEIMGLTPSTGTGRWEMVTPGIMVVNPNQGFTYASNFQEGSNQMIWSLSNGACTDYSQTAVTVFWENQIDAANDVFTLTPGVPLVNGDVIVNDDVDMIDQYIIRVTQDAQYGTATIDQDGFDYQANHGYYGPDEVMYEICSANCPNLCARATARTFIDNPNEQFTVFVPNVMSPNGDDKNDAFIIPELPNYPDNRLCMFNRWGDVLFETDNYGNDWNGTYNGSDLPAGTYYYVLFLDKNNTDTAVTGHMTIVR